MVLFGEEFLRFMGSSCTKREKVSFEKLLESITFLKRVCKILFNLWTFFIYHSYLL